MSYVHIGKSGGSSLACKLNFTYKIPVFHCPSTVDHAALQSEVSKQVVNWAHMQRLTTKENMSKYTAFVISLRHPVRRVLSAFGYHQRERLNRETSKFKSNPVSRMFSQFLRCFKTANTLATIGLSDLPIHQRFSQNMTRPQQCKALARECVAGFSECGKKQHFFYGIEFYAKPLLDNASNELFVIRNEYKWHDFRKLDILLGGIGVVPQDIRMKQIGHTDIWKNISVKGRRALCRIMCREIYYYKLLIFSARNLNESEVQQSLADLDVTCPWASLSPPTVSQFTHRTFPTLVGERFDSFGYCEY